MRAVIEQEIIHRIISKPNQFRVAVLSHCVSFAITVGLLLLLRRLQLLLLVGDVGRDCGGLCRISRFCLRGCDYGGSCRLCKKLTF